DVEQHQVEAAVAHRRERRLAIVREVDPAVTEADQAPPEGVAVVLVVVDDEQSRVRGIHARPLASAGSPAASAAILPCSRAKSTGLVSKSSQPAAIARSRSPVMAWADSASTGMCRVCGMAFR